MDFSLTALIALVSGTILGYISKIWRWAIWSVSIPLDVMYILVQENNKKKGRNIKFLEDKVDQLNPTQDSGMLINRFWVASYNITQRKEDSSSFSFFGGGDTSNLTYSVSCFRLFRQKLLGMIDKSLIGKSL